MNSFKEKADRKWVAAVYGNHEEETTGKMQRWITMEMPQSLCFQKLSGSTKNSPVLDNDKIFTTLITAKFNGLRWRADGENFAVGLLFGPLHVVAQSTAMFTWLVE